MLKLKINDSWLLFASFVLLLCQHAHAQESKPAFNKGRLIEVEKSIDRAIQRGQLVGCSALVFKDGRVEYFKTWGDRNREAELPVTRDTVFRIHSMTKPVTSVAAMQLIEQGKLELDAPISKYLPEFANLAVLPAEDASNLQTEQIPVRRAPTLRDLLSHTAGFTYGIFGNTAVDLRYRRAGVLLADRNLAHMVEKLGKIPLQYQPGTRFHYSVATDVVARIVEVGSGQRFDEYLDQHLFEPLEMKDTSFFVPEEKRDRFAQLYERDDAGKLKPALRMHSFRLLAPKNEFFSGGIGLVSTIDDYLNFARMLLDGGRHNGKQILRADSIELMFTDQLEQVSGKRKGFKFGLGFEISPRGDYSWGGAAGTNFWINPEKQLAILFMSQILPFEPKTYDHEFRDAVYAALEN